MYVFEVKNYRKHPFIDCCHADKGFINLTLTGHSNYLWLTLLKHLSAVQTVGSAVQKVETRNLNTTLVCSLDTVGNILSTRGHEELSLQRLSVRLLHKTFLFLAQWWRLYSWEFTSAHKSQNNLRSRWVMNNEYLFLCSNILFGSILDGTK